MNSSIQIKAFVFFLMSTLTFQSFIHAQEKIVFAKNREIHSMNIDGSSMKQLTDYKVPGHIPISCRPSISSSGEIAYIYDPVKHGWMSTYRMKSNGSNKTRISMEPNSKPSSTWNSVISPDGKYYVFVSKRSSNDEIYRMDADGSHIINISKTKQNEGSPKWSPDGSRVIYTVSNSKGGTDIVTTSVDGSDRKVLLHAASDLKNVCYSKDGKLIAYCQVASESSSDLMIADADGTNSRKIKSINKWSRLSFSPDNLSISFVSKNDKIATMRLDGSNYKELAKGFDPVWSFK